jgi:Leucine-rich repeat (LRR) protein
MDSNIHNFDRYIRSQCETIWKSMKMNIYTGISYLNRTPQFEIIIDQAFDTTTLKIYRVPMTKLPARVALMKNLLTLICIHNDATSLGDDLPPNLTHLSCERNLLSFLPELPINLHTLLCNDNMLLYLPHLPPGLEYLYCHNNQLVNLPDLPPGLKILNCYRNRLTKLPVLPAGLTVLRCFDNAYLYVPKKIRKKYLIEKTPNYPKIVNALKKIRKSYNRLKKVMFCKDLQEQIKDFSYRGVYIEPINLQKNWFI